MSAAVSSGTGGALLPNVGAFSYNGVAFSSLYHSTVTANVVSDDAKRITKVTEYTLRVVGVVTLNDGELATDNTWLNLRRKLEVQGAPLIYTGNGYGTLNVNVPGGTVNDVAYGPMPKILAFEPYGTLGSRIEWECAVQIPELTPRSDAAGVLQWSWDSEVQYDEAGYSAISINGILEIAGVRGPNFDRSVQVTVDQFRDTWENVNIDLNKFRVVNRRFTQSSDKRTATFQYRAEELPPCGLPPGCLDARGSMSVRKASASKLVAGAVQWACTLTATYMVVANQPRRIAAENFFALLSWRMAQSVKGKIAPIADNANAAQQNDPVLGTVLLTTPIIVANPVLAPALIPLLAASFQNQPKPPSDQAFAWLTDFSFNEGIYLDGKTVSFSATWLLMTNFTSLLQASGIWTFPPSVGGDSWASTMVLLQGPNSWLRNRINPAADAIVDFGFVGGPPNTAPLI